MFSVNFPLDIRLCRLLMYGLSVSDRGIGAVDVVLLVAIMASPDLHISPSRFHIKDPEKYIIEMKATLEVSVKHVISIINYFLGKVESAIWRCME